MSEDVYEEPGSTKIVRFQASDSEYMNVGDNVMIYENWSAAPKSEDNTTHDQQKITSVSVSSGKRNLLRGAAVFLGLLCLILLAGVIVLVVLWIQDIAKLTSERHELQTSYSEMESLRHNLTQNMSELEKENDILKARTINLTSQRDELQQQIKNPCCPDKWTRFGNSCYFISTSKKNWTDSKTDCEKRDAQLVIISSTEEQEFLSSFKPPAWIGLTYEHTEGTWKWVNGMKAEVTYWEAYQQDNSRCIGASENCAVIHNRYLSLNNWDVMCCSITSNFICEKTLQ